MMRPLAGFFSQMMMKGPQSLPLKVIFPFLLFCSWAYGLIGLLRFWLYRKEVFSSYRADVPVISVGNLTVGGTGKTPMVDFLARQCHSLGKKTAVISRGYGRKEIKRLRVVCHGSGPLLTPELAGDEPYLIARRNPFLIVIVSVDRKKGVAKAVKEFGAEVIILDDGFQNFGVRRDLDIVLLDAENPLGNGQLLPAGPLREFPSALSRGQLFVFTRAERPRSPAMDLPGEYLFCRHTLGSVVHSLAGEQISMADLKNRKGAAFAGVCNTERFFSDLAGKHLNIVETLAFSDHCMYGPEEIHRLNELAINADYLITTEKDAVKLRGEDLAKKCYAVPLSLQFFDDDKLKKLIMGMLE